MNIHSTSTVARVRTTMCGICIPRMSSVMPAVHPSHCCLHIVTCEWSSDEAVSPVVIGRTPGPTSLSLEATRCLYRLSRRGTSPDLCDTGYFPRSLKDGVLPQVTARWGTSPRYLELVFIEPPHSRRIMTRCVLLLSSATHYYPPATATCRDIEAIPMHILDLNQDVLLHVTAFLWLKDLSRLTRTCRTLHRDLVHTLLRERVLLTRSSLTSFFAFLNMEHRGGDSESGSRLTPFLRHLQFNMFPELRRPLPYDESVQLFIDLLTRSPNLVSLSIYCICSILTPQKLRAALGTLPCLEEVTLDSVSSEYQDVLAGVVSQNLRKVDLSLTDQVPAVPGEEDEDSRARVDPIPFLRYHRNTIVSLALSYAILADHGNPFPGVQRLKLFNLSPATDETGWVGPLVHFFPNAEFVDLWNLRTSSGSPAAFSLEPGDESSLNVANVWRTRAKMWQMENGTWTRGLQYLRVRSITDLYCLGLSCHITRLDVYFLSSSASITTAALADARLQRLWISIASRFELDNDVPGLMSSVAKTPSLTHLMVDISDGLLPFVGLTELFDRLGELLRGSSVTNLSVYVHDDDFPGLDHLLDERPSDSELSGARLVSKAYPKALGLLNGLVGRMSKIRRVFLELVSHGMRAWEVAPGCDGSNMRWIALDESLARQLLISEGMARFDADAF
ncbi:hypothetical protein C8Q79DRAFT_493800 [Trametes meyenii]|nr:hypothetical protein C8Q79DRAFT_493800 [Trametes meyenii]